MSCKIHVKHNESYYYLTKQANLDYLLWLCRGLSLDDLDSIIHYAEDINEKYELEISNYVK